MFRKLHGRFNFIARGPDGHDHAGGLDLGERHDDSFDFDAAGSHR